MAPVRLAHLVAFPIPYFVPLYRQLSARPEVELTVYFYSDATAAEFHDPGFGRTVRWDAPLLDGYHWKVLPSAKRPPNHGSLTRPNWDIVRSMLRSEHEVVWTHGYAHLTTWLCVLAARARGAHPLIREEQTLLHGRPWRKRVLKQVALRALFGLASGLYIGEQNRRYFQRYGMPDERLFPARYCVDNAFFQERAEELVRRDGIPGVRMVGFLNQTELPAAYTAADVFVLPSGMHETWGLVVNEAMNFSLPVIVSDKVGCGQDLMRQGWNGFSVSHRDTQDLAWAMKVLAGDPKLRQTFGARSRQLVSRYSIEACADGIVAACLASARSPRLRAGKGWPA